jgi:hypothetical protein
VSSEVDPLGSLKSAGQLVYLPQHEYSFCNVKQWTVNDLRDRSGRVVYVL